MVRPTRKNSLARPTTVQDVRLGYSPTAETTDIASVPVKFLGVFDTVGALGRRGLNSSERTHNMWLSPRVSFARHALAIDEHRIKFAPILWKDSLPPDAATAGVKRVGEPNPPPRIKQVWFQGAHSDVGGGATAWWGGNSLSTNSLLWMLLEAHRCAGININLPVAAIAIGGMGNRHEEINDSLRWWWWPTNFGRITRQAVAHDPDFQGYYRNLRPEAADAVLIATSAADRFLENDGYHPRNLVTVADDHGGGFAGILENTYRMRGASWQDEESFCPIC